MARQSTTPISYARSIRKDTTVGISSGRAGVVQCLAYIPLLAGDSAAGRVGMDVMLKEMPRPLRNGVHVNFQAWFVPKSSLPRFAGRDELQHAMTGHTIKAIHSADRAPPPYFRHIAAGGPADAHLASDIYQRLGIHGVSGLGVHTDLFDSFTHLYNFRLAAHSSKLPRRMYAGEVGALGTLPPAFWPSSRLSRVVADYERALVVGALDLDVAAGTIPVDGIFATGSPAVAAAGVAHRGTEPGMDETSTALGGANQMHALAAGTGGNGLSMRMLGATLATLRPDLRAEMAGRTLTATLADIDKARTTQAMAKAMASMRGQDFAGLGKEDVLLSLLMQGIEPETDDYGRPWLLDSDRVAVGFAERHATDAANLDDSVTLGRASCQLSLNVPRQEVGGMIIVTMELLPERIDERMSDEWLHYANYTDLPNALRDIQRTEPVDIVPNRRVDAKHASPAAFYGYEPMNDRWNRDFTRCGGDFYKATPGGGWTESRSNIWQTEIVNPAFGATHFLAPSPFPHTVFSDTAGHCFEVVTRHLVSIAGNTQIGDVLVEANDDYVDVATET